LVPRKLGRKKKMIPEKFIKNIGSWEDEHIPEIYVTANVAINIIDQHFLDFKHFTFMNSSYLKDSEQKTTKNQKGVTWVLVEPKV
jgi:hypothetical protein